MDDKFVQLSVRHRMEGLRVCEAAGEHQNLTHAGLHSAPLTRKLQLPALKGRRELALFTFSISIIYHSSSVLR